MNLIVRNAVPAFLLLAAGLLSGISSGQAADPRTQTQPLTPNANKGTTAKVIIVDRAAKAITVDIHGTIHLLWLSAEAKIHKDGKDATIADINPGQVVSFITRKTARGDVEVVLDITIESSDSETEAAGHAKVVKAKDKDLKGPGNNNKGGNGNGNGAEVGRGTPGLFAQPPVSRPVVSPHN